MRSIFIAMASVLMSAFGSGQGAGDAVPGLIHVAGVDGESGTAYALISLEGKLIGLEGAVPRLTAQCTKAADGKLRFELLADEPGERVGMGFHVPWKRTKTELFAPVGARATVTMEFLGYMKVKPVKRQWVEVYGEPGMMRYAPPGNGSSNMEEVLFYLQYLKALPTLRLTWPGKGVEEFETSRWQAAVKAEVLCGASGL